MNEILIVKDLNGWIWGVTENLLFAFLRKGLNASNDILVICNFQNKAISKHTVGITNNETWNVILNSDDKKYGGHGARDVKNVSIMSKPRNVRGSGHTDSTSCHTKDYSLTLDLPPVSVIFLKK